MYGHGIFKIQVELQSRPDGTSECLCSIDDGHKLSKGQIDSSIHFLIDAGPDGQNVSMFVLGDIRMAAVVIAKFLTAQIDQVLPENFARMVKEYMNTEDHWFVKKLWGK